MLSVIIPVFNEGKNIQELHLRLRKVLKKIDGSYEVIFVNDGSHDNSLTAIKALRTGDKRVKFISFSRNFGHMPAVSAGLKYSKGDKIVIMDADLQDPPEAIVDLYRKSKEGFDVVYGIKKKRKEGILKRFLFTSFYKIFNSVSPYKMPLDAGTFSIIDEKVANVLRNLPEKNKYISGLRFWAGFTQIGVVYERGRRKSGKAVSLIKLFKLAIDGIISFSFLPLRIASIFGFLCASIALISIILVLILRIFFGIGIVGWASTMSTILLMAGVQLITLGIIGEYLARIYDEVKGRPEYVISEKVGFKSS